MHTTPCAHQRRDMLQLSYPFLMNKTTFMKLCIQLVHSILLIIILRSQGPKSLSIQKNTHKINGDPMKIVDACNKSLFSLLIPRDIVSIHTLDW